MAASVTRILHLGGFSPAVTTKDIKHAFAAFDDLYKIKWIDDTSLYLVFNDPRIGEQLPLLKPEVAANTMWPTAKSAFLMMMGNLPPSLLPAPNQVVQLSPYNGSDADMIIARVEQRNGRSPSARSDISTAPNSVNLANVSPAVSLMLLAAVNAGPPGAISGFHGIGGINTPNGFQGMHGHAHGFTRRGSQTSLRSAGSQASLVDVYGFGASASGYGLGVGTGMNMGGLTTSSSWSNISPQFIPTTLNPYNDYPVAPSPRVHHVAGKYTAPTSSARQGLEDIAEASSREEISQAGSKEQLPSPARNPFTSNGRTPGPTSPPPSSPPCNSNIDEVQRSPSSELPSERAVSPGPSPSALSKKVSIDSLVKSFGEMGVSSSSEGSAPGDGLRTPPEQVTTSPPPSMKGTPPRIGNPGKRMLSHALGIRHPGLPPRVIAGVKEQAT